MLVVILYKLFYFSGVYNLYKFKLYRIVSGILIRNNKVLLVQNKDEYSNNTWSLPGGQVELHETLEQAIKREFLEETGLSVTKFDLAYISECFIPQFEAHSLVTVFLVQTKDYHVNIMDPDNEIVSFKWVDLESIDSYITNEQILNPFKKWLNHKRITNYSFDSNLIWNED